MQTPPMWQYGIASYKWISPQQMICEMWIDIGDMRINICDMLIDIGIWSWILLMLAYELWSTNACRLYWSYIKALKVDKWYWYGKIYDFKCPSIFGIKEVWYVVGSLVHNQCVTILLYLLFYYLENEHLFVFTLHLYMYFRINSSLLQFTITTISGLCIVYHLTSFSLPAYFTYKDCRVWP